MIEMMDGLSNLLQSAEKVVDGVAATLPCRAGMWRKKQPWRDEALSLVGGFAEGVHIVYDKLLSNLADQGIRIVAPHQGEPFLPSHHRAIETVDGGSAGTIARLVRNGYDKDGTLLRFADVAVYKNPQQTNTQLERFIP